MTTNLSPQWEKAKILGSLIATLGIPLALALVANSFSNDQKQMEIGVRYVSLATQILMEEPTSTEIRGLRPWAISVMNHYSRVPLPEETKEDLVRQKLLVNDEMHKAAMEAINRLRR